MKSFKRFLMVAASVLACLMMFQSPASAVTHTATISAGTSTVVKTGATTLVIDFTPTGVCPTGTLAGDITTTTVAVTALSSSGTVVVNGTTYVALLTRSTTGNATGTLSGTSLSGLGVGIRATLFALATGTTCTTTGTAICTLQTSLTFAGTLSGVSTGNTGVVSAPGATVSAAGLCGVPFSTYIGSTTTVTGLTFTT